MRLIEDYEIDTGAIEALKAIEKRIGDRDGPEPRNVPDRCPSDAK
jgi:hypothetical protein